MARAGNAWLLPHGWRKRKRAETPPALFTRNPMPYAAPGRTGMNDKAQKRAQKLRQALRENLKRRKAEGGSGSPESTMRREDRLEPRLGSDHSRGKDAPGGD
jgi:hypothetical protein